MRQQIIISFILAAVLSISVLIKQVYFPKLSSHSAYYFYSIFWICGVLIVIFIIHIIWRLATTDRRNPQHIKPSIIWPNRRKSYRIIYPDFVRPILVVEKADNQARRQLEYPVVDLSQEGICFIDDGSLGSADVIDGHIRFNTGERLSVTGILLRRNQNNISVQLTRSIAWPVILKEQRRLMTYLKPRK